MGSGCSRSHSHVVIPLQDTKCTPQVIQSSQPETGFPQHLQNPRLRIVVVGGGPAGLAAAITLQSQNHEVAVYERADSYASGFGWIILPNGVAALEELGVREKVLANCIPLNETRLWRRKGYHETLRVHTMSTTFTASRRALVEGLLAHLEPGTVRFGYQCVEAALDKTKQRMEKLVLVPTNQNSENPKVVIGPADFDVIVAADGVHSRIAACWGNGARDELRRVNTLVTVHQNPDLGAKIEGSFNKFMFQKPITGDDSGQCCALGLLTPAKDQVLGFLQFDTAIHGRCPEDISRRQSFVREVLRLDKKTPTPHAIVPEIVNEFFEAGATFSSQSSHLWRPVVFGEESLDKTFSRRNAILIGDAAHPLSDFTSQGVSLALEDAVALGKAMKNFVSQQLVVDNSVRSREFEYNLSSVLDYVAVSRLEAARQHIKNGGALETDFIRQARGSLPFSLHSEEGDCKEARPSSEDSISDPAVPDLTDMVSPLSGVLRTSAVPSTLRLGPRRSDGARPAGGAGSTKQMSSWIAESETHAVMRPSTPDACKPTASADEFFSHANVNMEALRSRAFNYRWAELDEGVIPLTAASSDFPVAPPIRAGAFCQPGSPALHSRDAYVILPSKPSAAMATVCRASACVGAHTRLWCLGACGSGAAVHGGRGLLVRAKRGPAVLPRRPSRSVCCGLRNRGLAYCTVPCFP